MGHTDDVRMDLTPLRDIICAAGNLNIHSINLRKGDPNHEKQLHLSKATKIFPITSRPGS